MNVAALRSFGRKHRDAIEWLESWRTAVGAAAWQNIAEVRRTYASADGVRIRAKGGGVVVVTVFNVKGNEYRLLTRIDYRLSIVLVIDVLTHAEYSGNRWKNKL